MECQDGSDAFGGRMDDFLGKRRRKGLWCVPSLTGFVVKELSIDVCLLIHPSDLLADTSPGNDKAKISKYLVSQSS